MDTDLAEPTLARCLPSGLIQKSRPRSRGQTCGEAQRERGTAGREGPQGWNRALVRRSPLRLSHLLGAGRQVPPASALSKGTCPSCCKPHPPVDVGAGEQSAAPLPLGV